MSTALLIPAVWVPLVILLIGALSMWIAKWVWKTQGRLQALEMRQDSTSTRLDKLEVAVSDVGKDVTYVRARIDEDMAWMRSQISLIITTTKGDG